MLKGIEGKKIVVVGDVILDHYRTMVPERVSPEAPVIIYRPLSDEWRLGGAANVANNLHALKAQVELCTVLSPEANRLLLNCSSKASFSIKVYFEDNRKGTIKERVVTRRQQVVRIDDQADVPIKDSSVIGCFNLIKKSIANCDVLVLSDYNHGVMTPGLCSRLMSLAKDKGIKVVVDSKTKDSQSKYQGATIALPNHLEARTMTGLGHEYSDEAVATSIYKTMKLEAIGLKMGARGIMLIKKGEGPKIFPPLQRNVGTEVSDVTGAGDTVTAMFAAALACGHSYEETTKLANIAAGIVVQKMGTSTASFEEVKSIWEKKS